MLIKIKSNMFSNGKSGERIISRIFSVKEKAKRNMAEQASPPPDHMRNVSRKSVKLVKGQEVRRR